MNQEFLTNSLYISLALSVFSVAYSVYMAYLNRKQAKVIETLEATNTILTKYLEKVNSRLDSLERIGQALGRDSLTKISLLADIRDNTRRNKNGKA